MPFYDPDFGKKLEEMEKAIGFLFPPEDFHNLSLANLLKTPPETMSRKKNGDRMITASDCSRLSRHFRLAQYDFESDMFEEQLDKFTKRMREIEKRAHSDAESAKTRRELYEISSSNLSKKLTIRIVDQMGIVRGIGGEKQFENRVVLKDGDQVLLKVQVPDNGFMYLFNEDLDRPITCLMPSKYIASMEVRSGKIIVPDGLDSRYFPVGGPEESSRLYAIWFSEKPELALNKKNLIEESLQKVDSSEFNELVAVAKRLHESGEGIMVAIVHYKVSER